MKRLVSGYIVLVGGAALFAEALAYLFRNRGPVKR